MPAYKRGLLDAIIQPSVGQPCPGAPVWKVSMAKAELMVTCERGWRPSGLVLALRAHFKCKAGAWVDSDGARLPAPLKTRLCVPHSPRQIHSPVPPYLVPLCSGRPLRRTL